MTQDNENENINKKKELFLVVLSGVVLLEATNLTEGHIALFAVVPCVFPHLHAVTHSTPPLGVLFLPGRWIGFHRV